MSVSPRRLPLNLEFLRKDAKQLVRSCRASDPAALQRIRSALLRLGSLNDAALASAITLADAQHAIAREHGHANWAALKRADNPLERLLVAVRGGALAEVRRHLPVFAPLADASVHAAAALGDRRALEAHLDRAPSLISERHADWPPLAYVASSKMHRLSARHAAGLLDCATLLLDRGADPNAMTGSASDPADRVPIVARAALAVNMPVAMLLMRRGADIAAMGAHVKERFLQQAPWTGAFREYFMRPDVREQMERERARLEAEWGSYIGGHFTPLDLRELHAAGKTPRVLSGGSVDLWGSLLDHGYDVEGRSLSGETVLHGVVRSAPPALVELLLARGVKTTGRTADGESVMAAAVRGGNERTVETLRRHGVTEDGVTPVDRFIGACVRLDAAGARELVRSYPGLLGRLRHLDYEVLVRAVSIDHRPLVALMLEAGVDPGGAGEGGVTALHMAAWRGNVEVVRLLLARGAPVDRRDTTYGERPIDRARHGATHCRDAAEDYRAVEALLEQGLLQPDA